MQAIPAEISSEGVESLQALSGPKAFNPKISSSRLETVKAQPWAQNKHEKAPNALILSKTLQPQSRRPNKLNRGLGFRAGSFWIPGIPGSVGRASCTKRVAGSWVSGLLMCCLVVLVVGGI